MFKSFPAWKLVEIVTVFWAPSRLTACPKPPCKAGTISWKWRSTGVGQIGSALANRFNFQDLWNPSPGPQGAILINHRKQRFQRLQGAARGTAVPKAGATAKLGRGDQATSFPAECNPNQLFSEHLPEGSNSKQYRKMGTKHGNKNNPMEEKARPSWRKISCMNWDDSIHMLAFQKVRDCEYEKLPKSVGWWWSHSSPKMLLNIGQSYPTGGCVPSRQFQYICFAVWIKDQPLRNSRPDAATQAHGREKCHKRHGPGPRNMTRVKLLQALCSSW